MNRLFFVTTSAVFAALSMASASFAAPVLQPTDFIIAIDVDPAVENSNYPTGEAPLFAIDGSTATKYLNFGRINTGFMITPSFGATTIQSMLLTTANDAPERDPATWAVYGTNDVIDVIAADNGDSLIANWSLIGQGSVALPAARGVVGPTLSFPNATAYTSYRVLFPAVKGPAGNSMQIAEVGLFASLDGTGTSVLSSFDPIGAFQLPSPTSRSPLNEQAVKAVDGTPDKYLNFGEENSGFIVTPAVGAKVVTSFQITTANDVENRDPASWALYGTNEAIVSQDHSLGDGENWTLVGQGALALPAARNTLGDVVAVSNTTAYTSYRMVFPTTKNPTGPGADSMQIAEIQFFDSASAADADFDNDGDEDGDDFLIWQRGVGVGTTNATGDADGNGAVDGADLAIWRTQFGTPAVAAVTSVPEPAAGVLVLLAAFGLAAARRGRVGVS